MSDRMRDVVIGNLNVGRNLFVDVSGAQLERTRKFKEQSEVVHFKAFVVEIFGGYSRTLLKYLIRSQTLLQLGPSWSSTKFCSDC